MSVSGLAIGRTGAVCYPHAGACAHHRFDRGYQTARGVLYHNRPVWRSHVNIRLTVGDDDDALAVQVAAQGVAQPLGRPGTSLLLEDAIVELTRVTQDWVELGPPFALAAQ